MITRVERGRRDDLHGGEFEGRRVHHHGRVDAVENAMLQHQDFSAGIADFFGRRAQHSHSDAGFIRDFRRCDSRAHGRCPAGSRIRRGFRHSVDRAPRAPRLPWAIGHAFFDTESGSVLRLAEPRRGVLLFEPEFGFGVDAMAEVQ